MVALASLVKAPKAASQAEVGAASQAEAVGAASQAEALAEPAAEARRRLQGTQHPPLHRLGWRFSARPWRL